MKISIIQSDSGIATMLGPILEADGFELAAYVHGSAGAKSLWVDEAPDLFVVEAGLKDPDAVQVCRTLKAKPEFATTPILILETSQNGVSPQKFLEAGCEDLLLHPIQPAAFLFRVRALVQLRRRIGRMDDSESVLYTLARTLEAKDRYTQGHMDRVAFYAVQLGKELGVKSRELDVLYKGGMLHDVGKIAIPDAVLTKPGKFTPEEFEVMKKHPVLGCQICEKLRSVRDALPLIRHHHERLDGTGYPDGLKGAQVPQLVRIVTIVDIYDALRSKRSYKDAFTLDRSFEILWEETRKGWWDETVLTAWERTIRTRQIDKIPSSF